MGPNGGPTPEEVAKGRMRASAERQRDIDQQRAQRASRGAAPPTTGAKIPSVAGNSAPVAPARTNRNHPHEHLAVASGRAKLGATPSPSAERRSTTHFMQNRACAHWTDPAELYLSALLIAANRRRPNGHEKASAPQPLGRAP